jgi:hypothetical protein
MVCPILFNGCPAKLFGSDARHPPLRIRQRFKISIAYPPGFWRLREKLFYTHIFSPSLCIQLAYF